jgi:hypothetical protein
MSDEIKRLIEKLETQIADWPKHNSQSNPGAVMELREMKADLRRAKAALTKLEESAKK